jgi:hypothetical protein
MVSPDYLAIVMQYVTTAKYSFALWLLCACLSLGCTQSSPDVTFSVSRGGSVASELRAILGGRAVPLARMVQDLLVRVEFKDPHHGRYLVLYGIPNAEGLIFCNGVYQTGVRLSLLAFTVDGELIETYSDERLTGLERCPQEAARMPDCTAIFDLHSDVRVRQVPRVYAGYTVELNKERCTPILKKLYPDRQTQICAQIGRSVNDRRITLEVHWGGDEAKCELSELRIEAHRDRGSLGASERVPLTEQGYLEKSPVSLSNTSVILRNLDVGRGAMPRK